MLLDNKQIKQKEYKPRKYKRKMSVTAKLWIAFLISILFLLIGAFCICISSVVMFTFFFTVLMVVSGMTGLVLGIAALSFTIFGED